MKGDYKLAKSLQEQEVMVMPEEIMNSGVEVEHFQMQKYLTLRSSTRAERRSPGREIWQWQIMNVPHSLKH